MWLLYLNYFFLSVQVAKSDQATVDKILSAAAGLR